jgi:hypothetical protein
VSYEHRKCVFISWDTVFIPLLAGYCPVTEEASGPHTHVLHIRIPVSHYTFNSLELLLTECIPYASYQSAFEVSELPDPPE